MSTVALSVSQLNLYVKSLLEGDRNLKSVWLRGELSNFVRNSKSGHCYFSLKDADSSVKGVMFKWQAQGLTFVPKDGMQVLVRGRVSLYERDGQYQFYAEQMLADGMGSLFLEFLRLKNLLESEGLFEQKKPLPSFPKKIGICTALTGAAIQDVLSVCQRLAPSVSLCVYPCQMQGRESPHSVLEGLSYFEDSDVDLVIIARGGGSYEDLAVFNDEALARTVAKYPLPVISAIGHETDVTILDFVADFRAATPSVAAEVAVGQIPALTDRFQRLRQTLQQQVLMRFRLETQILESLRDRINPSFLLDSQSQRLDSLSFRIASAGRHSADLRYSEFSRLTGRLAALNPLGVLSRGYALVESNGVPVRSAEKVSVGDPLILNFYDGVIDCVANSKKDRKL